MEKVCKSVCFELEEQFSTSVDLQTPKRFPGAGSCLASLDLSTIALPAFIQAHGTQGFLCSHKFAGLAASASCIM